MVYVALGSHASYPAPGQYTTQVPTHLDNALGDGAQVIPTLHEINAGSPSWVGWRGHWGGTRASIVPGSATSPTGPATKSAWNGPAGWAANAGECLGNRQSAGTASLPGRRGRSDHGESAVRLESARRTAHGVLVRYRVGRTAPAGRKAKLLLSLEGPDGRAAAQQELRVRAGRGSYRFSGIPPTGRLTASASTFLASGKRSPVVRRLVRR